MPEDRTKRAWIPPRWFIRLAWSTHRGLYRATGRAWYDDAEVTVEPRAPEAQPAKVRVIDDGAGVVMSLVQTHIVLWGDGRPVERQVAGQRISFAGEMCVVSIGPEGRARLFFLLQGTRLAIGRRELARFDRPTTAVGTSARATWHVQPIADITPHIPVR